MGRTTDTGEVITVDNTLETFTFGSTDNINELDIIHNVTHGDGVSELELTLEVRREFDELALGGGPCLLKWPLRGSLACISLISS